MKPMPVMIHLEHAAPCGQVPHSLTLTEGAVSATCAKAQVREYQQEMMSVSLTRGTRGTMVKRTEAR